MIFYYNERFACINCVKGHRASTCKHVEKELISINSRGRPSFKNGNLRFLFPVGVHFTSVTYEPIFNTKGDRGKVVRFLTRFEKCLHIDPDSAFRCVTVASGGKVEVIEDHLPMPNYMMEHLIITVVDRTRPSQSHQLDGLTVFKQATKQVRAKYIPCRCNDDGRIYYRLQPVDPEDFPGAPIPTGEEMPSELIPSLDTFNQKSQSSVYVKVHQKNMQELPQGEATKHPLSIQAEYLRQQQISQMAAQEEQLQKSRVQLQDHKGIIDYETQNSHQQNGHLVSQAGYQSIEPLTNVSLDFTGPLSDNAHPSTQSCAELYPTIHPNCQNHRYAVPEVQRTAVQTSADLNQIKNASKVIRGEIEEEDERCHLIAELEAKIAATTRGLKSENIAAQSECVFLQKYILDHLRKGPVSIPSSLKKAEELEKAETKQEIKVELDAEGLPYDDDDYANKFCQYDQMKQDIKHQEQLFVQMQGQQQQYQRQQQQYQQYHLYQQQCDYSRQQQIFAQVERLQPPASGDQ